VMESCWAPLASSRPTFLRLKLLLQARVLFFFSLLLSNLELSDTQVYEP